MPYTLPTPADIRARYAGFSDVSDETISYWLTDAQREADASWPIESDIAPAQIAVAAHNMLARGVDGLPTDQIAGLLAKGVTDFKSGSFSASLNAEAVKVALAGGYASTQPGLEYLRLLRRNRGGPIVSAPGAVPDAAGYNGYAGATPWP